MPFLYSLLFANSKKYIGITTKSIDARFKDHKKSSKTRSTALYNAWRKYGQPEIRALAIVEEVDLAAAEIRAIAVFNTRVPFGYNTSFGGDISPMKNPDVAKKAVVSRRNKSGYKQNVGIKRSAEYCQAMSIRMTGKKLSEETKAKVVAAIRSRGPQSQETIDKRKESMNRLMLTERGVELRKKRSLNKKGKPVSERLRRISSETHKGKVLSDETKRKISEKQKARLSDPKLRAVLSAHTSKNRIGVTLSEDTKRKISEALKRRFAADRALCDKS